MNELRDRVKRDRRGERGSILAISALGMLAVLLAVGLGVDISRLYLAKAELQNAADAAALAGASAINSLPNGITAAVDRATNRDSNSFVNNYEFNHKTVDIVPLQVTFAATLDGPYISEALASSAAVAPTIRFVKVSTQPEPIQMSFAAMVLGDAVDLSAEAIAGASIAPNVFCNWIPLTLISADDASTFVQGQTYTIRSAPAEGPSAGNYQILAVDGRGGEDVESGTGGGVHLCKGPGETYAVDTKPGITAGKVRKGINARFGDYQGSQLDPANYPPDLNVQEDINYDQYSLTPHNDRRMVIIPIVKISEFDQGRNEVKFYRFGLFFLQTKVDGGNGGAFKAEFRNTTTVMGGLGYDPDGGMASPELATPVLYK
ncbi:MAG: Tad domain-containing protein [Acidobacteriota bacterium]|nr:Tad domain-containing protein [Acidobacteriota bacterium]